jgi:hypothetical protein
VAGDCCGQYLRRAPQEESSKMCISKSYNKKICLFMKAVLMPVQYSESGACYMRVLEDIVRGSFSGPTELFTRRLSKKLKEVLKKNLIHK